MTIPWETCCTRPPQGPGDPDIRDTQIAQSRALTSWELLELHYAILYSIFRGGYQRLLYLQEYQDRGNIFDQRLQNLSNAADQFAIKNISQEIEGEFQWQKDMARRLSKLRNEIAHAMIIADVDNLNGPDQRVGHRLVPPVHHFLAEGDPRKYSYNAANLLHFEAVFRQFTYRVVDLIKALR